MSEVYYVYTLQGGVGMKMKESRRCFRYMSGSHYYCLVMEDRLIARNCSNSMSLHTLGVMAGIGIY